MTKLYAVSVKDSARFEKGTTFGMFVISIIYEIDVEITNMKLGYTYKKNVWPYLSPFNINNNDLHNWWHVTSRCRHLRHSRPFFMMKFKLFQVMTNTINKNSESAWLTNDET